MKKDSLGIEHKEFKDYLREPSAQGHDYDVARAGKWKQREQFTNEEQVKIKKLAYNKY